MVVLPFEVAGRAHAQRCGEGRARVARPIGVMGGFRHFRESGQALVLANGMNLLGTACEHFVDIGLVGNVKDDFVPGRFKDAVEGDA